MTGQPLQHDVTTSAPLQALVGELQGRHGTGINSVLFYGSCLRSGNIFDGLVDLYVIVDSYRACYGSSWQALANWVLPPNVFYIELPVDGKTLRCKYTVISSADLERGASRWFQSYIWGRFTQPVDIIYNRDEDCREWLQRQLRLCTISFLNKVLPRLADEGRVQDLWYEGLRLSYRTELRAESNGRARELIDSDRDYYEQRLHAVVGSLKFTVELRDEGTQMRYRARVSARHRLVSRMTWLLRRVQGKLLSVLRLVKALFTFEGGVDYVVWKLERHSGQSITIPDRVKRYPLIFIWGFALRLYCRGVFH